MSIHVYVNDDTSVSMWQYGVVEDLQQPDAGTDAAAPLESRTVQDVEVLRAMADPTRLAILSVLMMEGREDLPVLSVKEIAARIGEPQTKLYRHVKQLEAAGLIHVAATRLVSGILEQRYQASQRDVLFDSSFIRAHADDTEVAFSALLDAFRTGFFRAFRDERLSPDSIEDAERYRLPTIAFTETRVNPARATEIRERLRDVMKFMDDKSAEDPDGVLVNVLIGYYTATEPQQG
jgi:DNA-binding transcriptional ArsR family regulator